MTDQPLFAFCHLPFNKLKVTSEGDVTQCCFQQRKCLGNLFEQSIEEIWKGQLANEIRSETAAGRLHSACNTSACPFYHLREFTAYPVEMAVDSPSELEIDLPSQHCNVGGVEPSPGNPACFMCERHRSFEPQTNRIEEVCKKLRPIMPGIKTLHIQGIAEPFWKGLIFRVLDWLGAANCPQLQVTSTTNGTILGSEKRRMFLQYPYSSLSFSIDAGTPETYRLIRRLDLYDKVMENLSNYCIERKKPHQAVKIHNNINILNIDECVSMVEAAMVAGVDRIEFNPTYGTKDVCVNEHNVGAFRRAQREIQAAATSLNMPVWFLRDFGLDYGEGDDTMTIGVSDSHIRSMSETHWLSEQVLRKRIAESSYLRLE